MAELEQIRLVSNGTPGGTYLLLESGKVVENVRAFTLTWRGAGTYPEVRAHFCPGEFDLVGTVRHSSLFSGSFLRRLRRALRAALLGLARLLRR